jgi:hypothetical protein
MIRKKSARLCVEKSGRKSILALAVRSTDDNLRSREGKETTALTSNYSNFHFALSRQSKVTFLRKNCWCVRAHDSLFAPDMTCVERERKKRERKVLWLFVAFIYPVYRFSPVSPVSCPSHPHPRVTSRERERVTSPPGWR